MIRLLLSAVLIACAPFAAAQGYPAKPVRVVIPYPPGGGAEAAARLLTVHLSQALGQSFVIDPKPGGNTLIGTEIVAKSPGDGYTLLFTGGSTMSVQPFVFAGKLPYDPLNDFAPVSMVSRFPFFAVVPASMPAKTLAEFVAAIRERRPCVPSFHDGARVQAVIEAIVSAAASRRSVDVPRLAAV